MAERASDNGTLQWHRRFGVEADKLAEERRIFEATFRRVPEPLA